MSHSVFRDLDDDDNNSSGNISKGAVADSNIVVFIDKNGDVTVDPNALQDFVGKFERFVRLLLLSEENQHHMSVPY